MVCYGVFSEKITGNGIMDSLMKNFTAHKYPGENHAYSMDPKHIGQNYNWVGPGTDISTREKLHDDIPLNKLDAAAKKHDYAYLHEKEEYIKDHDKKKHINNVWKADQEFINEANNQNDDPVMGKISANLIRAKRLGEQTGILSTEKFSGFGKKHSDPTYRLKMIAKKHYKHADNNKKHEKVIGGAIPLIPIGISLLSALGGKLISELYDKVKEKIQGKGYRTNMNHKTIEHKRKFLNQVISNY